MKNNINIVFEKVLERDIDLMVINQLCSNNSLLYLFLDKINKQDYKVDSIEHSLMDQEDGESDITVILSNNINKIAILIEDKIDTHAMPMQPERYMKRGNKGIEKGLYDEFYDFIIAPKDYLNTNEEAKRYNYNISYEEMLTVLTDIYSTSLINKAIEEKKNGYTIIENEAVTIFWKRYYSFIKDNFPSIKFNEVTGPRGANAKWPELLTNYKDVRIIHKSDRGYLDLTFNRFGEHIDVFSKYVENLLPNDFNIVKTGKSLAIRAIIPVIEFKDEFDNYINEMNIIMNTVLKLYEIVNKLNILLMYNEITKDKYDINSFEDINKYYKQVIVVNYDKRIIRRSSTNKNEWIADIVDFPYIQRYQTGINPTTSLLVIKDNNLYKLTRLIPNDPNSNYKMDEIKETVSDSFFNDKVFNENANPPVNVKTEELLEIIETN